MYLAPYVHRPYEVNRRREPEARQFCTVTVRLEQEIVGWASDPGGVDHGREWRDVSAGLRTLTPRHWASNVETAAVFEGQSACAIELKHSVKFSDHLTIFKAANQRSTC